MKAVKIWSRLLCCGLLTLSPMLLAPTLAHAEDDNIREVQQTQNDWQLIRDDKMHHIKAYAKQEDEKKFRSFRIEALIDAPLEVVARIQLDADNLKRWYWSTGESTLLKRVSDKEFYYYQVYKTPLVPDRDVVIHGVIEPYSAATGAMILRLKAVPDYIPNKPSLVRMAAHDIVIKFTPTPDNKTRFEAEGYIDPAGVSPSWAINFYQRKSPYLTLMGMQRAAEDPFYKDNKQPLPYTIRQ